MFRLNKHAGLPVVAGRYENLLGFQTLPGNGAHLEFPGAYVVVPLETTSPSEVFFHFLWCKICFMSKLSGLLLIFPVWILFASTNIFFQNTYMYWSVWWADVLMHLWGGFLLVATVFLLRKSKLFPKLCSYGEYISLVVLVVAMVGWEIYEYVIGHTGRVGYLFDTTSDFVIGLCGGLVAYYIFKSRTIRK